MSQARSKVSVLGAGRVGSAVANALVLLRVCDLVVLYDRDLARAEGQAWDIGDAVPLLSEMVVVPTAEYSDLDGSDVVVVTVGPTLAVGQTRLDLARVNAGIIAGVVRQLDRVCPAAVVILVSNPVDVLTRIAIEASTRPPHLIFGCGTVLDGARLRHQLGKLLEERMLQHSAAVLDKAYQSLGAGGSASGNDSLPSCAWPANPWPEPGTPRQPAANWARHPPAHGALPGHTGPARRTAGAPTLR
jgi:malate/lactate dehydrogenase